MHLIVSFAAPQSAAISQQMAGLRLPHLQACLAKLAEPLAVVQGDEWTLSAPHEQALALALGWPAPADGLVPLAAWAAQQAGLPKAQEPGWALLTPAHWSLGTEQVSLLNPALLKLDVGASKAFHAAVADLFTSEGFEWHWLSPTQWLCRHAELAELPTASLDRVVGRNVDRWLTPHPLARRLRRLQNEVQMLLHTHALNAEREGAGQLALNSLWCSATGLLPRVSSTSVPSVTLDHSLREAALEDDAAAWQQAFERWDAQVLPAWQAQHAHNPQASLTLCGERAAWRWQGSEQPSSNWLRRRWDAWRQDAAGPAVQPWLERL